jgi:hypothetical protein
MDTTNNTLLKRINQNAELAKQIPNGNMVVSIDEALDLIAHAKSLEAYDKSRNSDCISDIPGYILQVGDNKCTIADIYAIAECVEKVSPTYLQKAIRLRYPTKQEQLEDIKKHEVVPSLRKIVDVYENRLRNDFNIRLKGIEILTSRDGWRDSITLNLGPAHKLNRRENILINYFMSLDFNEMPNNKYSISITLKDYRVLAVCGDSLLTLRKKLNPIIGSYIIKKDY